METTYEESYVFKSNYLCFTTCIGEHLNGVFMQVGEKMNHRMDFLKNNTKIRSLTKEDVHYCEPKHGTIFREYDVKERLDEILMNSWEISYQQKNVLIREPMGDENINISEINELCIVAGVTCDEPCVVV